MPSRPTPRRERCSVVRDFCGHGLGRLFHDEPNILHVGRRGEGVPLRPGMFFTIEPMINLGGPAVKVLSDGWTAVTRDRSLSAQFEHTVGVTETGVRDFHAFARGPGHAAPVAMTNDSADEPSHFRPSRAAARSLSRGGARCGRRLRTDRADLVSRDPAPRRQAARQGADRTLRLLRRGDRGAARRGSPKSRA